MEQRLDHTKTEEETQQPVRRANFLRFHKIHDHSSIFVRIEKQLLGSVSKVKYYRISFYFSDGLNISTFHSRKKMVEMGKSNSPDLPFDSGNQ